jgi:quercetin dioxygenase-like cupin family protein
VTVVAAGDFAFADLPGRRSADPLAGVGAESSVRIVELERTAGRSAHRHPLSEEIVYVVSGEGRVWIDGVWQPVSRGDIVHIAAGAAHATVPKAGSAMRLVCFFPHPDLAENLEPSDIQVT